MGRLLGAASGCLFALCLTCAVFIWTHAGQRLDQRFLLPVASDVEEGQRTARAFAHAVLAFVGDPTVLAGLLAGVLLVAVFSGRVWAGLLGVGVVGGSILTAQLLKTVVHRPDLDVAGSISHNSFPSGHVAAAAGLLFAVLLAVPGRARWWCAMPGAVGVSLVAAATMIAGWHRLSDTIGSVLLAATLCCLAAAGRRAVTEETRPRCRADSESGPRTEESRRPL